PPDEHGHRAEPRARLPDRRPGRDDRGALARLGGARPLCRSERQSAAARPDRASDTPGGELRRGPPLHRSPAPPPPSPCPRAPPPAFADLVSPRGRPSARELHYRARIFPELRRAKISPRSLYSAWDFTVASRLSLTGTALFMRDDALAKLGDTTPGDGVVQGSAPSFTIERCTVAVSPAPPGCTTS